MATTGLVDNATNDLELMNLLNVIGDESNNDVENSVDRIIVKLTQSLTLGEMNNSSSIWNVLNSMLKFKCNLGDVSAKYNLINYKQIVDLCLKSLKLKDCVKDACFSNMCTVLYHSLLLLQSDVFKRCVTIIILDCQQDVSSFSSKTVDEIKSVSTATAQVYLRILETVLDVLLRRQETDNISDPFEHEKRVICDNMNTVILSLLSCGVENIAGQTALYVLPKWVVYTNDDYLIKTIWINITTDFNNKTIDLSSTFQTLCILVEFYLPNVSNIGKVRLNVIEDDYFWNILQLGLTHSDPFVRKQALYLMKRACDSIFQKGTAVNVVCSDAVFKWDPAESDKIWEQFFLIMETLEEKQVHLIKPVLPVIDFLSDLCLEGNGSDGSLHVSWLICIFNRIVKHDSIGIVKWGVLNFIRVYKRVHSARHGSCAIQNFLEPFMNSINNSSLYSGNTDDIAFSEVGEALKDLLECIAEKFTHKDSCAFFRHLLNVISGISWAPVPLFNIAHALSRVCSIPVWDNKCLTVLKEFISQALSCQYVFIRGAVQCMLLEAAINLTDTNNIDIHTVANFLGSLRGDESLKRGTLSWNNAVEWLKKFVEKEEATKFISATLPPSNSETERLQLSSKTMARMIVLLSEPDIVPFRVEDGSCALVAYLHSLFSCFENCGKRPYVSETTQNSNLELISCLLTESHTSGTGTDCFENDVVRETITFYANRMLDDIFTCFSRRMSSATHLQDFHVVDAYLTALDSFIAEAKHLPKLKSCLMNLQNLALDLLDTPTTPPMSKYFSIQVLLHVSDCFRKYSQCECTSREHCMIYETHCVVMIEILKNGRINVPPSKQEAELKLTRDLQTLWGKLTSGYLAAGWSMVANFLYGCKNAESHVLSIRSVDEMIGDIMQALEIGGRNVLVPVVNVLEKIILKCLTTENTDTPLKLVSVCWNMIFEFRKTELFWTAMEAFIQMLFQPSVMTTVRCQECLREYSNKIFMHGDTISGLPNILIAHLQKMVKMSSSDILEPFTATLVEALTFGPVHRRDQRIITETCKYIALLGEKCSINQLASNNCYIDSEVRACAVQLLLDTCGDSRCHALVRKLMDELIEKDRVESFRKSRYYGDSKLHRLKHRVMQSILLLQPHLDPESVDVLAEWLQDNLLRESQQPSVRYQQEWLLVRLMHQRPLLTQRLWTMFQEAQEKRPGSICSFIAVVYHIAVILTEEQEAFVDRGVREILPWCMAQHFSVRLYAQTALQKLLTLCRNKHLDRITEKYAVVESSLRTIVEHGNAVKNAKKLEEDFYFTAFHPLQHYTLQTIFYELPRLSNITCEEWISVDILESCGVTNTNQIQIENSDRALKEFSTASWIVKAPGAAEEDGGSTTGLNDNVQKKLVPWRSMIPNYDIEPIAEMRHKQDEGLIVVASLIDRLPNLGGLSRTCEVFGVSEYVVASLKYTEDKQFRSLSVTAEQWIPITEVKPHVLGEYMELKKRNGYTLIGAEQTARRTLLNDVKFPKKTLLLLGNEKEGIPADLLPLLDMCVEIPQQGVVRSLNVHVTGALFIWEYAKQHSVK